MDKAAREANKEVGIPVCEGKIWEKVNRKTFRLCFLLFFVYVFSDLIKFMW